MITRDVFEQIEPRIGNYFIKKNQLGKYEILKDYLWYVSDAVLSDPVLMWIEIEPFDSLVKAYVWLKENVDNLL